MDTIAGTSESIITLLKRRLMPPPAGLPEYRFEVFGSKDITNSVAEAVSLFLYRVDVDPMRRHIELPDLDGSGQRQQLGLELHYLLTVWGGKPDAEQKWLERCIQVLDEYAILSGDDLAVGSDWPETTAIKLAMVSLSNEDLMRLWDAFDASYRISVAYSARTVRLDPISRGPERLATSLTNVGVPSVPPRELRR